MDSAIHWINHYPVDNSIGFPNTYPLVSDLSGGEQFPTFEQPGPGKYISNSAGCRPLDKGRGGGGHPGPEIRGGPVWSKNKGGGGPLRPLPWIRH